MGNIELLGIAVGLSMDAFAVSICKGLGMKKLNYLQALLIGLFFGGFQALMPVLGWLLGCQFEQYINSYDHWIAFVLLSFIGGKMIYDACRAECEVVSCGTNLNIKELTVMSVATSIDALAVGVSFAFFDINIWRAVSIIGLITFVLCVIGVAIGNKFGGKHKKKAGIVGGVVLIIIGLKMLLEGLGVIGF